MLFQRNVFFPSAILLAQIPCLSTSFSSVILRVIESCFLVYVFIFFSFLTCHFKVYPNTISHFSYTETYLFKNTTEHNIKNDLFNCIGYFFFIPFIYSHYAMCINLGRTMFQETNTKSRSRSRNADS